MHDQQVEFLLRCARIITRRLLSLGCSHADAEDIVQNTIIKTLVYLDGIPDSNLQAWMTKVAVNDYHSLYRRMSREHAAPHDALDRTQRSESDTPIENLLRREDTAQVQQALQEMAGRLSSLLMMKYRDEMTYRQISSATGLTLNSVKTDCIALGVNSHRFSGA